MKSIRELRNISQDDLAELLGVGQNQIWRWETNKRQPSAEAIYALSQQLDTTADYLLGLVDDPNQQVTENDLSSDEKKLIHAYRTGQTNELLQLITAAISDKKP